MLGIPDLRRRTVDPSQLAGVTSIVYADGPRRGAHAFIVRNMTGLEVTFVSDRALDAAELRCGGIPLTWYGPGNARPPRSVDPSMDAFDRTFFGGLVTTCGMDAFGPPGSDAWGAWPQHGHFNRLAARDTSSRVCWNEPEPFIEVAGTISEFRMFGAAFRVRRTWRVALQHNSLSLCDHVTNDGGSAAPHMVLYHCNVGYPLLDAQTVWEIDAEATTPRDAVARAALGRWNVGGEPEPEFSEEVFIHVPRADEAGWARATATNPALRDGTSLTVAYRPDQLPALFTWRMLGYGTYVMAAEPANCAEVRGREAAAAAGTLPLLQAGETREYQLLFTVECGS